MAIGVNRRDPLASVDDVDKRPLHDVIDDWRERMHPIVEDCACGGQIPAASASPDDVIAAVQRHQVEPRHIAYDLAQGIPWSEAQRRAAALDAIGVR